MAQRKIFNQFKRTKYGWLIYNPHDLYVGRSIELYGEYSENEIVLFRQIIKPGFVIIDAGANIGSHTLVFALLATETGKVIAFEPQRIIFQMLCANMSLNSITNAFCYQNALADKAGSIDIPPLDYSKELNYGGLSLDEKTVGEPVKIMLLDDLDLKRCDFIKIDVEGMELQVLKGAKQLLKTYQPILYVENDRKEKSHDLIEHLLGLDYRLYWHLPFMYNPDNFHKNAFNIFQNIISANMLCLPPKHPAKLEGFKQIKTPDDTW